MSNNNPSKNRILNVLPSKKTEDDWQMEHSIQAGVLTPPAALPASVDLREAWWKVGDQRQTGSCVGWATADSLLRWHFVKSKMINRRQRLSVRFIWMAAKETDDFNLRPTTFIEPEGTSLKAALDVARKYGEVLDSDLPFDTGHLFAGDAKTFYAKASIFKVSSYFNLNTNLADWKTWLATKGPIMTRLEVDDTWYNAHQTGGKLDEYHPPALPAGHAVSLVGYTPDRFIVRNSWGTQWGDNGFGYASLNYAQAAFTEAYGISV